MIKSNGGVFGRNPTFSTLAVDSGMTMNSGNIVMASGGGIDFSATTNGPSMSSEVLSDYEEGTWTPTLTPASGTITTSTLGTCNYTKIGRAVSINFSVVINDVGTASGVLTITAPFANGTAIANGCGRENALTGSSLQASIAASSSDITIRTYANSGPLGTNAQIRISMTYFT
jgi:hypothetical protein